MDGAGTGVAMPCRDYVPSPGRAQCLWQGDGWTLGQFPRACAEPNFDLNSVHQFNLLDLTRITLASRVDVHPGEDEVLDIANRPYDDNNCYGWNNETYFATPRGRNPNWRLAPARYLVRVVIRSSGRNCKGYFRLINDVS
jgi:hypothetical protein